MFPLQIETLRNPLAYRLYGGVYDDISFSTPIFTVS